MDISDEAHEEMAQMNRSDFNRENFKLVLDKIESCPANWKQNVWHCGTSHCFGGWAQLLSGKPENGATVIRDARQFLRITFGDARWLFDSSRTIQDFHSFLNDRGGYDRGGYDRDGYDRDGYGRDGYDRDGYGRGGYDRGGYDRGGYDRGGYDRGGYGRGGYDRGGYDRGGYDRGGYDRDGYDRGGYDRGGYDRDGLDANFETRP